MFLSAEKITDANEEQQKRCIVAFWQLNNFASQMENIRMKAEKPLYISISRVVAQSISSSANIYYH